MSDDINNRLPRGTVMNVLSILIAAAALVFAVTSHSTDNTAEFEQRVAAVESHQKATDDALAAQVKTQTDADRETQRRLDTIDGRTIDIYHVLLDMQQHEQDQRSRK